MAAQSAGSSEAILLRRDRNQLAEQLFPCLTPLAPTIPAVRGERNAFGQETCMFKFIGGTIGAIFLIGLIVVVLFFKLIF
jgi:hypothetical protein